MSGVILKSERLLRIAFLAVIFFSITECGRSETPETPRGELAKIAETFKIEVLTTGLVFPVKSTYGTIEGKNADAKALQDYSTLFAPEFSLYPPDLMPKAHLKRVVLCRDLAFAGQRRNAIPDFEHDTLYLDVSRGTYSKAYLRKVIHHEFFHMIDFRDDGNLYKDDSWQSLNPASFRYGSGGKTVQDVPETSVLTTKLPGFINHYSTTGVEEDKAEVFANLIVDFAYVESRTKNDSVLNNKVNRMKKLLNEFCPAMNDKFWETAQKSTRSDE
ncbi:MAG: hypothetical protein K8T25_21900 [Planctomycetia bacterium]|nr:hypothetical protein [Planctomycetia bacterium]